MLDEFRKRNPIKSDLKFGTVELDALLIVFFKSLDAGTDWVTDTGHTGKLNWRWHKENIEN